MMIVFLIVLLLVSVFWKINQNEYAFYNAQPSKNNCIKPCPQNVRPVYDTNGNRYPNACTFSNAKCNNPKLQLRGGGGAPSNSTPNNCDKQFPKIEGGISDPLYDMVLYAPGKCNSACPENYMPVYDTNGKQYGNMCGFNFEKCKNPKLQLATGTPKKPNYLPKTNY